MVERDAVNVDVAGSSPASPASSGEMVERVARASFSAHQKSREHAHGLTWDDNAVDWEKDEYRVMARAAIAAMREPTEAQCSVGCIDLGSGGELTETSVSQVWCAMIDEAMK